MMAGAMTKEGAPVPSVGILLTTYNGQDFVREQLDSLLAQIGVSVHIYAFDDSSTDGTMSILRAYAEDNPGIFTLSENKPNSGGTGLNIFRNAPNVPKHHDYVALADQDDVWLPQKLQRAIEALSRDQADLYFSDLLAWDGKNEIFGVVRKASGLQAYDHLFAGGSAGCTYVLSRSFFTKLQEVLARTDLRGVRRISHDWIIYFLARHYGYKVCASSDALIKYRIHSNSQYGGMSRGGFGALWRKLRMLRAGFLRDQIDNALRVAREGTEDREILLGCTKGRWSRLAILLKYRFSLVRSKPRLFSLAVALLAFR
jgi:rhamnosyltransferase